MKNNVKDFQELRNKKRKRRRRKKLLIFFLIVIFGFTSYFTRGTWLPAIDGMIYKIRYCSKSKDILQKFPIQLSSSSKYDLQTLQDKAVLLTDTNLTLYNIDGTVSQNIQHQMLNPNLICKNQRALVYDISGNRLIMQSRSKTMYTKRIDDTIIYANISDKGYVATVTSSDTYSSLLTIYNKNGDEIFKSNLKDKVLSVHFNRNSTECFVSTMLIQAGDFYTKHYKFNFRKEKEVWSGEKIKTVAISGNVMSSRNLALIGDMQYNVISTEGKNIFTYKYDNEFLDFSFNDNFSAVLLKSDQRRTKELLIINKENKVKRIHVDSSAIKIKVFGKKIYVLNKKSVQVYSDKTKLLKTIDLDNGYTDFTIVSNQLYLLKSGELSCIKI